MKAIEGYMYEDRQSFLNKSVNDFKNSIECTQEHHNFTLSVLINGENIPNAYEDYCIAQSLIDLTRNTKTLIWAHTLPEAFKAKYGIHYETFLQPKPLDQFTTEKERILYLYILSQSSFAPLFKQSELNYRYPHVSVHVDKETVNSSRCRFSLLRYLWENPHEVKMINHCFMSGLTADASICISEFISLYFRSFSHQVFYYYNSMRGILPNLPKLIEKLMEGATVRETRTTKSQEILSTPYSMPTDYVSEMTIKKVLTWLGG